MHAITPAPGGAAPRPCRRARRWLLAVATAIAGTASASPQRVALRDARTDARTDAYTMAAPKALADTGLYADWASRRLAASVREYTPRFALYSDQLVKRRFIDVPAGARIEPIDLELWRYPSGVKIWKEFGLRRGGSIIPIETRYMEKQGEQWAFASYVWNEAGTEATKWQGDDGSTPVSVDLPPEPRLAPSHTAAALRDSTSAPTHTVPAYGQCLLCHDQRSRAAGQRDGEPVLGFTSFQLTREDLTTLVADGTLAAVNIPWQRHRTFALNVVERDVAGYLHANCGHCHNPRRPDVIPGHPNPTFHLNYSLETHTSRSTTSLIQQISQPYHGGSGGLSALPSDTRLIHRGSTAKSMLYLRMQAATDEHRMPLIGTVAPDLDFINGRLRPWIQGL